MHTKGLSPAGNSAGNFGCKIVLRRCRASSSATALRDLGLTTLSSRRKLHMAQCMFRCLSSHSPPYLSRLFSSASSHYTTQSSSTCQLNLPPVKTSFGQKAYSFAGASLWRTLPAHIRNTKDYYLFTRLCQNFINTTN